MRLNTIIDILEEFAPLPLQEGYDNSGLQIGNPESDVNAALLCLDVTEEILDEAVERGCDLIISHHPLLFKGLKSITGATPSQRIVERAIREGIAIYSAHTNLDSATRGVSHEMARMLRMSDCRVLVPSAPGADTGLGVVGNITPTPAVEFLRRVKDIFQVKALRYSASSPQLVIRRVALCGGSGAEFIADAIASGADAYLTGDVKYHSFTDHAQDILIADIGHYESEVCTRKIFARLLRERLPEFVVRISESEHNPIEVL